MEVYPHRNNLLNIFLKTLRTNSQLFIFTEMLKCIIGNSLTVYVGSLLNKNKNIFY